MVKEKEKKPEFEESLKRIEEIVAAMEKGSLPLEQALERYEEGVRLTRFCSQTLDAAEKKIEILSKGESGEETVRQFAPDAGGEDAREAPPSPAKRRNREEEQFLL
ncbi:MAG: exodeoxyribonuclease VII small subunit [Chlamydiota bacterium]